MKELDLFGSEILLRFRGIPTHNTKFGSMLTLLILAVIGLRLFFIFKEVFERKNPTVIYQERFVQNPAKFTMDSNSFQFAFGMENSKLTHFVNSRIYTAKFIAIYTKNTVDSSGVPTATRTTRQIDLVQCTLENFPNESTRPYFQNLKYSNMLCLPPQEQFDLEGDFSSSDFQLIKLSIAPCTGPDCEDQTVIDSYLAQSYFAMYFSDAYVDPTIRDDPFMRYGRDLFWSTSNAQPKQATVYFRNNYVDSDFGWIVESIDSNRFPQYSSSDLSNLQVGSTTNFFSMYMRFEKSKENLYQRRYKNINSIISEIGGFTQSLLAIGFLICSRLSQLDLNKEIINEAFNFEGIKDSQHHHHDDQNSRPANNNNEPNKPPGAGQNSNPVNQQFRQHELKNTAKQKQSFPPLSVISSSNDHGDDVDEHNNNFGNANANDEEEQIQFDNTIGSGITSFEQSKFQQNNNSSHQLHSQFKSILKLNSSNTTNNNNESWQAQQALGGRHQKRPRLNSSIPIEQVAAAADPSSSIRIEYDRKDQQQALTPQQQLQQLNKQSNWNNQSQDKSSDDDSQLVEEKRFLQFLIQNPGSSTNYSNTNNNIMQQPPTSSNQYQNASAISNIHDASLNSYPASNFQSNIELQQQQLQQSSQLQQGIAGSSSNTPQVNQRKPISADHRRLQQQQQQLEEKLEKQKESDFKRLMQKATSSMTLSVLEYIKFFFWPFGVVKQKKQIIDYSIDKLYYHLDVLYVVKKLLEVDKLKRILLDQHQLKLFEYIPKPTIRTNFGVAPPKEPISMEIDEHYQDKRTELQKAQEAFIAYKNITTKQNVSTLDRNIIGLLDPKLLDLFGISSPQQLLHYQQQQQQQQQQLQALQPVKEPNSTQNISNKNNNNNGNVSNSSNNLKVNGTNYNNSSSPNGNLKLNQNPFKLMSQQQQQQLLLQQQQYQMSVMQSRLLQQQQQQLQYQISQEKGLLQQQAPLQQKVQQQLSTGLFPVQNMQTFLNPFTPVSSNPTTVVTTVERLSNMSSAAVIDQQLGNQDSKFSSLQVSGSHQLALNEAIMASLPMLSDAGMNYAPNSPHIIDSQRSMFSEIASDEHRDKPNPMEFGMSGMSSGVHEVLHNSSME